MRVDLILPLHPVSLPRTPENVGYLADEKHHPRYDNGHRSFASQIGLVDMGAEMRA